VKLKLVDDRPRELIIQNLLATSGEVEANEKCRMRNSSLEIFICGQIDYCTLDCTQKTAQNMDKAYVKAQEVAVRARIMESFEKNLQNKNRFLQVSGEILT
jgi:hypothetical protein